MAENNSDVTKEQFEKFQNSKQEGMERVFGPLHEIVFHAIIPFLAGGGVDMYPFCQCIPGTVFATMELVGPDGSGPKPNRLGTYELVACTRHQVPPKSLEDSKRILKQLKESLESGNPSGYNKIEQTAFDKINDRIYKILTLTARFSFEAKLEPNETAEIPGDENEPGCCLIFDEFRPNGKRFEIVGKPYGLLLCMEIYPSEMRYAMQNGGKKLIDKLRAAGVYPYSDMDRSPVV
jgi:hypothetical protein